MPSVILKGKVIAKAIGKYKLGLAFGAAMRIEKEAINTTYFNWVN